MFAMCPFRLRLKLEAVLTLRDESVLGADEKSVMSARMKGLRALYHAMDPLKRLCDPEAQVMLWW